MAELSDKLTWTPNIWQGVAFEGILEDMAEGQRKAILSRIPALRQHPAAVKFISFEPLIGPIPKNLDLTGIDWSFFGGESHPTASQARFMDLKWLRAGIALCESHACKPHVKQLGTSWPVSSGNYPPPAKTDRSAFTVNIGWGNVRTYGPKTCARTRFTRCGKSRRRTFLVGLRPLNCH